MKGSKLKRTVPVNKTYRMEMDMVMAMEMAMEVVMAMEMAMVMVLAMEIRGDGDGAVPDLEELWIVEIADHKH